MVSSLLNYNLFRKINGKQWLFPLDQGKSTKLIGRRVLDWHQANGFHYFKTGKPDKWSKLSADRDAEARLWDPVV